MGYSYGCCCAAPKRYFDWYQGYGLQLNLEPQLGWDKFHRSPSNNPPRDGVLPAITQPELFAIADLAFDWPDPLPSWGWPSDADWGAKFLATESLGKGGYDLLLCWIAYYYVTSGGAIETEQQHCLLEVHPDRLEVVHQEIELLPTIEGSPRLANDGSVHAARYTYENTFGQSQVNNLYDFVVESRDLDGNTSSRQRLTVDNKSERIIGSGEDSFGNYTTSTQTEDRLFVWRDGVSLCHAPWMSALSLDYPAFDIARDITYCRGSAPWVLAHRVSWSNLSYVQTGTVGGFGTPVRATWDASATVTFEFGIGKLTASLTDAAEVTDFQTITTTVSSVSEVDFRTHSTDFTDIESIALNNVKIATADVLRGIGGALWSDEVYRLPAGLVSISQDGTPRATFDFVSAKTGLRRMAMWSPGDGFTFVDFPTAVYSTVTTMTACGDGHAWFISENIGSGGSQTTRIRTSFGAEHEGGGTLVAASPNWVYFIGGLPASESSEPVTLDNPNRREAWMLRSDDSGTLAPASWGAIETGNFGTTDSDNWDVAKAPDLPYQPPTNWH